ncbi:hypothetical protein HELRODRAFT_156513 [Helobdella robusta]|uniref:Clathrin adaptor alpha/beta/gamma-adaptin appendage Ig-like subdomain domain-containing protein n=1 Tax=Helobdella robusta TaxID=6412 RepID=T1ELX9_HELRO|nr:hypothetical protein HELRODRAFT_156513 [Helobdella robusta]ESO08777.1 hypothetical protein HELRODRAFT_156513 [Helobdella robusta]
MLPVKGDGMRGLAVFISDIRSCKSKEAEIRRINKELANIRSKFKGDKTFDGYQRKKYICKLLFIFLLGHDIDFGHMEAVNLLSSNKYTEKQIGYLFISVLISGSNSLINLIIQSLKSDLSSSNVTYKMLALQCIANIGCRDMCDTFAGDVIKFLVSGDSMESIKQCASLCLLSLIRNNPGCISMSNWAFRLIHLLNDKDLGVVTSAISLIQVLATKNPKEYRACVPIVISRLNRIVMTQMNDLQDYTYYFIPAPWLSVKLLKLLQIFNFRESPVEKNRLVEVLDHILQKNHESLKSKKVQHVFAKNAVLLEAINLIVHVDGDQLLLVRSCNILGNFLIHREINLRFLALEGLCLLATTEYSHNVVKRHQELVLSALKTEKDIAVRQRAADLLYAMCDRNNVAVIVYEMLAYLENADHSLREEMVLKIAILSEKYAVDYTWYVDTILHLIKVSGDYVSDEVWYRVVKVIINRDDVQGYAAKTVFECLQAPSCHENMVRVGGYILGEFGNLIAGDSRSSPLVQYNLLMSKYALCTLPTKQLLLSTFVKFANLFPEIKSNILQFFKSQKQCRNSNIEIQQRSVEYSKLIMDAPVDVLAVILEEMPPYVENQPSLMNKLRQKVTTTKTTSSMTSSSTTTTTTTSKYGNLYEDDLIQIGVRSEFRKNLGRLHLYYGNKSLHQFTGFRTTAQVQKQQLLNIECADDFTEPPILVVHFKYCDTSRTLFIGLPILLNKFIEGSIMDANTFFVRWNNLSRPSQEVQKIILAKYSMNDDVIKQKLSLFGLTVLDGIDPNPVNIVSAGILNTASLLIGVLVRLELNHMAQMYRLTVRAYKDGVAGTMCSLLEQQL